MSTGTKRKLCHAAADAEAMRDLFPGCFERWTVAGSVRRGKPEVGDIEHVVIPKFSEVSDGGLFGETKLVNLLWERADMLLQEGAIGKHVYQTIKGDQWRWGEKYRGIDFRGFNNEIFTATPENYGAILLIRTGPADFSKRMVERFLNGGMYRQQEGRLIHVASGEAVSIPDEETYFRLLGMEFIKPEDRR